MLEAVDYSGRRGVIVSMFDAIYALLKKNAEKDVMAHLPPPEHIILWKQSMRGQLMDVNRRWFFAFDGKTLAGLAFFHLGGASPANPSPLVPASGENIYLDEFQLDWAYRHSDAAFNVLLEKFANDREVAAAAAIFASERVKNEENKEILASVGFKDTPPDGYQRLGTTQETASALKQRYRRV